MSSIIRAYRARAKIAVENGSYKLAEAELLKANAAVEFSNDPLGFALGINQDLATVYCYLGDYAKAADTYKYCLSLLEQSEEFHGKLVAILLSNIGRLQCMMGSLDEAESKLSDAIQLFAQMEMLKSLEGAQALSSMALVYRFRKNFGGSEKLYLLALEIDEELAGPTSEVTMKDLNNLASLYQQQGYLEEAMNLYNRVLEFNSTTSVDFPTILSNIASLYDQYGDQKTAETLYLRAIELRKTTLGERHPSLYPIYNNLAELYSKQKRKEKAEHMFKHTLSIMEGSIGLNNSDAVAVLNNLARL